MYKCSFCSSLIRNLSVLSKYAWKSPEMSFMTGLKIQKRKEAKTDGQSEENACVDTHQHGGLNNMENCYYVKAAGCLMKH